MAYRLGNVKPWVAAAANEVGPKFGIRDVGGFRLGAIEGTATVSDHALGLALDFMCDIPTGNRLASYVQQNAARLSVTYIIHNRRIWNIGRAREGWRVYHGINPHTDHVHVSFDAHTGRNTPSNGGGPSTTKNADFIPSPIPGVPIPVPGTPLIPGYKSGPKIPGAGAVIQGIDSLKSLDKMAAFIADPKMWLRVVMFGTGMLLLAIGIRMLIENESVAQAAAKTAGTATRSVRNAAAKPVIKTRALANGNEAITSVTKGTRTIYKGK